MEMSLQEAKTDLISMIVPFAVHIHTAKEQNNAFKAYKDETAEDKTVVLVMDFAENLRSIYQNEPQSAHFNYDQYSIVTMVAYYKCQKDNCQENVEEEVVFFSPQTVHDAELVEKCTMLWRERITQNCKTKPS